MSASQQRTDYSVKVGSYRASSGRDRGDRQLLSLVVDIDLDAAGGVCLIEFAAGEDAPVAAGDAVSVSLNTGDGATTVYTGTAGQVRLGAASERIEAWDALALLSRVRLAASYESVSADFIIKDLLQKVGAKAGQVATGPELAQYAVHPAPSVLAHVQRLAGLAGAIPFCDGQGAVQVLAATTAGNTHRFRYGETVIALALQPATPAFDSVEAWGEGAASAKGADKAHWLTTDLAGVAGKAALGQRGQITSGKLGDAPLQLIDGALRSGEAVQAAADNRMRALAARSVRGYLDVFAAPAIQPGDTIELERLPAQHPATRLLAGCGPLRVRRVRHTLDRARGLVTRVGF
ncbi:contractile injection system protein, VgrG/Pvc8 family [Chitinolyticbacter meiyuanensis]|uniref:contractile injection system protein, VgrG/Pvc8 family n=1 Tax=Chitinolyticbacter meiyuanensis TaxID=682798 RepID=UPI0011E5A3C3|nr:contractile injection system protein, VgrG/Pvc8 family [Chitinolyticbacter meiyuanensis]